MFESLGFTFTVGSRSWIMELEDRENSEITWRRFFVAENNTKVAHVTEADGSESYFDFWGRKLIFPDDTKKVHAHFSEQNSIGRYTEVFLVETKERALAWVQHFIYTDLMSVPGNADQSEMNVFLKYTRGPCYLVFGGVSRRELFDLSYFNEFSLDWDSEFEVRTFDEKFKQPKGGRNFKFILFTIRNPSGIATNWLLKRENFGPRCFSEIGRESLEFQNVILA